jgi:preprotein translocase subunit SecG
MILAELLNISINLLLVLHVVVSLLLILVVLMQRPKQEGLGAAFGGGVADQVWGAQTTNVLQKGTVYLGVLFMLLSLVLAILIGNQNHQAAISTVAPPAVEAAPEVPADTPEGGTILEELEKAEGDTTAPAEGEAPAPTEETAPAPVEETAPAPAEETAPAPVEETAPAPVEETTPAPGEGETAPAVEGEEDKPQ